MAKRASAIAESNAANHSSGVQRQRLSPTPSGGKAAMVVDSVAVHDAPFAPAAGAGVQVTAAPRFAAPFENCTVPVGPCAELLADVTIAVNVTIPPRATMPRLGVTCTCVAACVMVMDNGVEVPAL